MNSSLAYIILKELIKLNVRTSVFGFDGNFTPDELSQIKELTITNCDGLEGISKLKNIKKLTILGSNLASFNEGGYNNSIANFSEINNLNSLEELNIYYDENIEILDISKLQNLKKLNLFCNSRLEIIKGLENKEKFDNVIMVECPIIDIGDIEKYIKNTQDTVTNIIDVKMFVTLFSRYKDLLLKQYNLNLSNITYGEHIYFHNKLYTLTIHQMIDMYERIEEIITRLELENLSDNEKVYEIYNYVINYLTYDTKSLDFRNDNYEDVLFSNDENKKYIIRRMAMINTSYGALNSKKAVCDGYVNLIRLLCSYLNIKTRTVICKRNELTHAALKYKIDEIWNYADPEQEKNGIRFFGLTRNEFGKLYKLSNKEYLKEQNGVKTVCK